MLDLDRQEHSVAEIGQRFDQLDGLLLEQEVIKGGFRAGPVVAADLHLLDESGAGAEDRRAVTNREIFDSPEVEPLHRLDQAAVGVRKTGL